MHADENDEHDWGFEEPMVEVDSCMRPFLQKARMRFVIVKAKRQEKERQALVKQFVLELACKTVGSILFVYLWQKVRTVYACDAQDLVVPRDAASLLTRCNLR